MTELQSKLVELDKKKEEIKKYYQELEETLSELKKEHGNDFMFQDEDGIVYQIIKPTKTVVIYKEVDYIRTKKENEKTATLSLKKAQEAGFEMKKGK